VTAAASAGLTSHERRLASHRGTTGGFGEALAQACGAVRRDRTTGDERTDALVSVAAGVGSPLLVGYVLWVLGRARDLGLPTLVFVARDGQVLARVARILAGRLDQRVDVRYVHASRRTTNLAATTDVGPEDLEWMLRHATGRPLASVLERVDLTVADAAGALGVDAARATVSGDLRDRLAAALRGDLRAAVLERAAARRPLALDYLQGAGYLGAGPAGIVDLGGYGSQVRALHALRGLAGLGVPKIFLMGLEAHRDPPTRAAALGSSWLADTECWLFDGLRGGGRRPRGLVTFAQMCCAADHGTTVAYERARDEVRPVIEPPRDERVRAWGIEVVHATVAGVAARAPVDGPVPDDGLRDAVVDVVAGLWRSPSRAEAGAWGSFPFEDGAFSSRVTRPLAAPYTLGGIVAGTARRTFPDLSWTHWHEAAVARSPGHVRIPLALLEGAYRVLRAGRRVGGKRG
jgi:hypothetical protein